MLKKGLIVLAFGVFLALSFVNFAIAQENVSTDNIDRAYDCLENQTKGKNLSLKEATFSMLALGSKGNLADRIESFKDASLCWPKGACNVKETAQVALAYNRAGKETGNIKKWLLSKNATAG